VSIFNSIMSKIFGSHEAAAPAEAPASVSGSATSAQRVSGSVGTTTSPTPSTGGQSVDVEAVLTELASNNSQQLNWRTSIGSVPSIRIVISRPARRSFIGCPVMSIPVAIRDVFKPLLLPLLFGRPRQ
jgi:uncharacterized protein DUF3597